MGSRRECDRRVRLDVRHRIDLNRPLSTERARFLREAGFGAFDSGDHATLSDANHPKIWYSRACEKQNREGPRLMRLSTAQTDAFEH
jgi:hypothetical protein